MHIFRKLQIWWYYSRIYEDGHKDGRIPGPWLWNGYNGGYKRVELYVKCSVDCRFVNCNQWNLGQKNWFYEDDINSHTLWWWICFLSGYTFFHILTSYYCCLTTSGWVVFPNHDFYVQPGLWNYHTKPFNFSKNQSRWVLLYVPQL